MNLELKSNIILEYNVESYVNSIYLYTSFNFKWFSNKALISDYIGLYIIVS